MREADILYRTLTDRVTVTREVWNGARWVSETVYQELACALSRALFSAGSSMDARMAMMAITTRSSINVNDFFTITPFFLKMYRHN